MSAIMSVIMLNVIMSVIMLNVIMSVIMLNVIMSVIMSVIMLNVIMSVIMSVIMLNCIMLSVFIKSYREKRTSLLPEDLTKKKNVIQALLKNILIPLFWAP
jgi:hypothetical protein